MPLYEYRCHKCGNVFEVMQKFSDEPVTVHPECGGEVEKLISRSAFQLKGSGWYATDYAKSGGAKDKGGAAETKTETKTETKAGGADTSSTPSATPSSTPAAAPSSSSSASSSDSKKS